MVCTSPPPVQLNGPPQPRGSQRLGAARSHAPLAACLCPLRLLASPGRQAAPRPCVRVSPTCAR
eukprot:scaffold50029_cov55-Phaeocystis_antarctica.AAC.1